MDGDKDIRVHAVGDVRPLVEAHIDVGGAGHDHVVPRRLQQRLQLQGDGQGQILLQNALIHRAAAGAAVTRVNDHGPAGGVDGVGRIHRVGGLLRRLRNLRLVLGCPECGNEDAVVLLLNGQVLLPGDAVGQGQLHTDHMVIALVQIRPVLGVPHGIDKVVVHCNGAGEACRQLRAQHVQRHLAAAVGDAVLQLLVRLNEHGLAVVVGLDTGDIGRIILAADDDGGKGVLVPVHLGAQLLGHKPQGHHGALHALTLHHAGGYAVRQRLHLAVDHGIG